MDLHRGVLPVANRARYGARWPHWATVPPFCNCKSKFTVTTGPTLIVPIISVGGLTSQSVIFTGTLPVTRSPPSAAVPNVTGTEMGSALPASCSVPWMVPVTALPFVRDGRLRALAVTTRERLAVLPDVPTVAETFPGYEATTWFGLAAPRGLPAETEARLRGAITVVQADAGLRGRFGALGLIMLPARDAPAIAATLAGERARWGDIIRARGITLEQ